MPRTRPAVVSQAAGWSGLLAAVGFAATGPLFASRVAWAAAAVLALTSVGFGATLFADGVGAWVPAAFAAWPLLAPSVAAAASSPGIRMILLSVAPAVVAVATWWLRMACTMPRWPVVVVAASVAFAIGADLVGRDPFRELRCHPLCVENPWVVRPDLGLVDVARWSLVVVTVVAVGRAAAASVRRPPPWWRVALGVVVAALAVGSAVDNLMRERRAPGSSGAIAVTAVRLCGVAVGAGLALVPVVDQVLARRRTTRWATDVAGASSGAVVLERLRRAAKDPTLRLLVDEPTDASPGDSAPPSGVPDGRSGDRATTVLARRGVAVAVIEHRAESADRVRALVSSPVVAALENEVLLTRARRNLDGVRAARRAVVERSDAARRSLQQDLHDGAQQRLIVLGLELSALARGVPEQHRLALESATRHAAEALQSLRHVAQGALPQVLDDEGLWEALLSLAEGSPALADVRGAEVAGRRFVPEVERAAYRFVASSADLAVRAGTTLVITTTVTSGQLPELVLTVASAAAFEPDPMLDDWVASAGGSILAMADGGRVAYEVRFPCE